MLIELFIFVIGIGGLLTMTSATMGVCIVAFACLLGIIQRLAQARSHHAELKKLLSDKAREEGAR